VKPGHPVFTFGTSAQKQNRGENMQNAKETREQIERIESWKCRALEHKILLL
jgi:hypothetical protein